MESTETNNSTFFSNLSVIAFSAILIQLPVYQRFIPLTIGLWFLVSIIHAIIKRIKPKLNAVFILCILLYSLIALSGLWSENKPVYNFDLEVKMSLVIFPIIFSFTKYSKHQIRSILLSAVTGLLLSFLFLMGKAVIQYLDTREISQFFYANLSNIVHPSYLSYYVNVGLIVIILDYISPKFSLFKKKSTYLLAALWLSFFSVILLSKNGILTTGLILLFLFAFWFQTKKFLLLGVTLGITVSVLTVSYFGSSIVQNRISELFSGLESDSDSNESGSYSTGIRIKIWEIATNLAKDEPILGYGAGDTKDVLVEEYDKAGFSEALIRRLNAHNQFLQITLSNGIIGLLTLLGLLLLPFFQWTHKNWHAILFSGLTIIFFITESVLETQAGVLGFVAFLCLFSNKTFKKE